MITSLDDIVGTHHVVVRARGWVRHVLARDVEVRPDVRGLHGIRLNGVLVFSPNPLAGSPDGFSGKYCLGLSGVTSVAWPFWPNNKGAPPAPLRAAVSAA